MLRRIKVSIIPFVLIIIIQVFIGAFFNTSNEINTIGDLAFNKTDELNYIYVLEDDSYVPYLVLHNNYDKTHSSLVLRKNIIGGKDGYYEAMNGTIAINKIYYGQMDMNGHEKYEDTTVDKYLVGDFPKRFDENFLNSVEDTEISFSYFMNGIYDNYEIKRKFFILSFTELNFVNNYLEIIRGNNNWDNKSKNRTALKYFSDANRRAATTKSVSMCLTGHGANLHPLVTL